MHTETGEPRKRMNSDQLGCKGLHLNIQEFQGWILQVAFSCEGLGRKQTSEDFLTIWTGDMSWI